MKRGWLLALALVACGPRGSGNDPKVVAVGKPQGNAIASSSACTWPLSAEPLDAEHIEGVRIVEVCITGASAETHAVLKNALHLGPEKPLGVEALRRDLASIYATDLVNQVEATARKEGTRAVLFFNVTERPRIADVTFEGLSALANDPAAQGFPRKGAPTSRAAIHAAATKLRDAYAARGWDQATVTPVIEPDGRVKIKVVEGQRAKFGKIAFEGAQGGRDVPLRKAIEVEEGATFSEDLLERAGLLVNAFYYDRGYLNVKVATPKRTRAADGTTAITFPITEGPIFKIGSVRVSKADPQMEKDFLTHLKFKSGEVFSRAKVVADLEAFRARSRQSGKPVEIEPRTDLDPKKGIVDLDFVLSPAP